jgi:hypothetical protein
MHMIWYDIMTDVFHSQKGVSVKMWGIGVWKLAFIYTIKSPPLSPSLPFSNSFLHRKHVAYFS